MSVASEVTSKLTERRALTHEKSKTPRPKPEAQTAVRRSDLVRQSTVHHSKNFALGLSAIARWPPRQATAPRPNPLCVFASLRLCVEIDALKTQRRKAAKLQRIKPTCAFRRTN